jgi:nucleotide-binding universal stress UspA family protein
MVHDPFNLDGWNLPLPSVQEEYLKLMNKYKKQLHKIVSEEKGQGIIDISESVVEGDLVDEIVKVVESRNVDLLIMLGHAESRIEHFLFGHTNDALLRKMPCSILVVKKEPGKSEA